MPIRNGGGLKTTESREDTQTGLSKEAIKRAFADNLYYVQGRPRRAASKNDLYMALAFTVRDRMLHRFLRSTRQHINNLAAGEKTKLVAYLSAEFLTGLFLGINQIAWT